jgi:hypothetical protein
MPPKKLDIPHIEVADADEAMRKAEDFGRKILRVPKKAAEDKPKKKKSPH